jgi:hypothetical protein
MPEKKERSPRVLILGRREDLVQSSVAYAGDLNFEGHGALTNEEAMGMIDKGGKWDACCIGTVFKNAPQYAEELNEMRAALKERGIPTGDMKLVNYYGVPRSTNTASYTHIAHIAHGSARSLHATPHTHRRVRRSAIVAFASPLPMPLAALP